MLIIKFDKQNQIKKSSVIFVDIKDGISLLPLPETLYPLRSVMHFSLYCDYFLSDVKFGEVNICLKIYAMNSDYKKL